MEQKYYTVDEAAEKIGVHSKTIRRYIYNGKIAAQKIGGQWRIYEDALDDYMTAGAQCCGHDTVSKDDFCVFMDSDYFQSDEPVQICTIVDYYAQSSADVKPMANAVMDVITDCDQEQGTCRFNYVYDRAEKKARFVFWGTPTFIEKVVRVLKPFE